MGSTRAITSLLVEIQFVDILEFFSSEVSSIWGVDSVIVDQSTLGQAVETTAGGGNYNGIVYDPGGKKLAIFAGATLTKATIPLPGGATAIYNSSGLEYIRHKDWLGSSRLATTWGHGVWSKEAYAPFGETYNEAATPDRSFTGQDQDTALNVDDFPARRYDATAGRWLSPDPGGWGTVSPANPQSLNRYAYVLNNPLSYTDPSGLDCAYFDGDSQSAAYIIPGDCYSDYDEGVYIDASGVTGAYLDGGDGDIEYYSIGSSDFWASDGACMFVCTVSAQGLGYGSGSSYQAPYPVAYTASLLVPVFPAPGVAGIALGAQFAYVPSTNKLYIGVQGGLEVGKAGSLGALWGNTSQIKSVLDGWGVNLSGAIPLGTPALGAGLQVQDSLTGDVPPAWGFILAAPAGVSGSIGYSWEFNAP